jgi:hypothetical protein
VLRFRAHPVVLADIVLVVARLDEDHAALALEFILDFGRERNLVVLEFAAVDIFVLKEGLAGRLANHSVFFELNSLFLHSGCRVHALELVGHCEVLIHERLLCGFILVDRHLVLP